ncbi:MAG: hypothetical protein ACC654_05015 [Acidimicrobiia bacterium]
MTVYRSPLRLFLLGVVGLVLIVVAIDVMFVQRVSTEPENTDGVLTTRGQAQQRGDILLGAVMFGAGTLLFGGGIIELVRRRPVVRIQEEGLTASIGTTVADVTIPWSRIESISSTVTKDVYDGGRREQLVVAVVDRTEIPSDVVSAQWDGNVLRIDATDWTKGVTEVALSAQGALRYFQRVAEIEQMENPSLVWETSAVTGEPAAEIDTGDTDEEPE